jgi:hypothetical protein
MPPRFSAMPLIEGKRSSSIMEARDTTQCCVCVCVYFCFLPQGSLLGIRP